MDYALIKDGQVRNIIVADQVFIALIADEWDHAEPLETLHEQGIGIGIGWGWNGSVFVEPTVLEPAITPRAVTMRQARLALLSAGLLDDVAPAIASISDSVERQKAEIEWEYSQEVQRHNGFVSVLAPMLGLNDGQIDALFILAAAL